MPDEPAQSPVARGDRREEVWIEDDRDQLSKVRFTFPTQPPVEQVAVAGRDGLAADDAEVTDSTSMSEDPSAWEALEDGEEG